MIAKSWNPHKDGTQFVSCLKRYKPKLPGLCSLVIVRYTRHETQIDITGDLNMAKHKFEPVEFVDRQLTESEKKAYKKWSVENNEDTFAYLDQLVLSQCKLSMSYNERNQAAAVSITCKDTGDENYNRCVTSRHSNIADCLLVALFKHFVVLFERDWLDDQNEVNWG